MAVSSGLLTSNTDEWWTPRDLLATLDLEFRFTLDPCAGPENAAAPSFYTRDDDGLAQPWPGRVWVNPPYGRTIGDWVAKAHTETAAGRAQVAVCLLPARTDTAWWHEHVMAAAELRLIRSRLRFWSNDTDRPTAGAPFPSAVVVFRPFHAGPPRVSAIDRVGLPTSTPGALAA